MFACLSAKSCRHRYQHQNRDAQHNLASLSRCLCSSVPCILFICIRQRIARSSAKSTRSPPEEFPSFSRFRARCHIIPPIQSSNPLHFLKNFRYNAENLRRRRGERVLPDRGGLLGQQRCVSVANGFYLYHAQLSHPQNTPLLRAAFLQLSAAHPVQVSSHSLPYPKLTAARALNLGLPRPSLRASSTASCSSTRSPCSACACVCIRQLWIILS